MTFLDETVRSAAAAVEGGFFFRKLGLPFDYLSRSDDFPSKAFATTKEARSGLPNPMGIGGGFAFSCRNHALMFDSYLLRLELGIETESDAMILDRLIGGLIRLATVAPKAFLVGGLAPDGRGFYAVSPWENHAAWSFSAFRGLRTAAIAPESQEKFKSIAGKWFERLTRDRFHLTAIDGKPVADGDLTRLDPDMGPVYLAALLTAAAAGGGDADYAAYAEAAEQDGRARLMAAAVAAPPDMDRLLWRQAALSVVAEADPEPGRASLARDRMRENAIAAAERVPLWREWDKSLLDADVDLNWRTFAKIPWVAPDGLGFIPGASWNRLFNERALEDSLKAMLVLVLAGDGELAEPHVPEMEQCLAGTPWDKVVGLSALSPALAAYARGVELGLWDRGLYDSRHDAGAGEAPLAAKYLEPGYDDENPEKAGHVCKQSDRKHPQAQAKGEGGRRRKRKRWK